MALSGKMEVDIDVKSSPDKYWETIRNSTIIFPEALPEYESIEVLEGDGKAVGSIRLITYTDESPLVKVSKEKIEDVNEAEKTCSYRVIDGDLLIYYNEFKAYLAVKPKGDGSHVKWSCEYTKSTAEVPDPHVIKDFAVKNFKEIDDYVLKA